MRPEFIPMFIRCNVFAHFSGILAPIDEFQYWADVSESAEKKSVKELAAYLTEQFKPIQKVSMHPIGKYKKSLAFNNSSECALYIFDNLTQYFNPECHSDIESLSFCGSARSLPS